MVLKSNLRMHFCLEAIVEINMPGLASNMCLVEDFLVCILVRGVYIRKEKQNYGEGYTSLYFPGRTLNYKCAAYSIYKAMKYGSRVCMYRVLYISMVWVYIRLHSDIVRKAPDNI